MVIQPCLDREVARYDCFPEIVLFDLVTKQTILLPEWEAAIYSYLLEQQQVNFDALISFFNIAVDELEFFEQHIEMLKQLKLIELSE
ncbi:hypothetical protein HII17_03145 [Thalassotalea sp. M1531]|uniref:Uncharacterized protein n=1 Tax=Thalassotalea algicola TaxID=2716224 RepID=A0A7Y0LCH3_9GAMM|nr:hypothetical protein [Thalassotalea algicola]NMP30550.1 hypothetical protein [Thalassotalea algicola]